MSASVALPVSVPVSVWILVLVWVSVSVWMLLLVWVWYMVSMHAKRWGWFPCQGDSSLLREPQRPRESFCTLQPNSWFPASTHSSTLCAVNERPKKKNPLVTLLDQRVVIKVCCCCQSWRSPFWSRSHAAAFMASSSHSSRESSLKP